MREIRSPLDGILSPFAARAAVDAYAVQGLSPLLVADFTTPYYRKAGSTSTFDSTFTHSRAGNATMVDSDGLIKWTPHNLALNSAAPATQSITVVSGADYTVEITGSGSVALTGAGTGTVTAGNPVEITASTTTLTLTVTGTPSTMWAYRSDLGGMVNNPDRGDSYVPTTSAAVYQARRNHYTYNGTSWVNSGLLLETEARENKISGSNNFLPANNYWQEYVSGNRISVTPAQAVGPDGETSMTLIDDGLVAATPHGLTTFYDQTGVTVADGTNFTVSCYFKNKDRRYVTLVGSGLSSITWFGATIDLETGLVTKTGAGASASFVDATVENLPSGIYRLAVTGNSTNSASRASIWIFLSDTATPTYGGYGQSSHDGAELGVYIYGAQLEVGSTPSSYMPTAGAAFTRPTESLQIAAADMPWDASNVSLQMQGKMTYADDGAEAQQTFARWYDDANNYITIDLDTDSTDTGEVNFEQKDGTGGTGTVTADTYSPGILVPYNIASRNTSTAINGATDGTAGTEDTTPTALPDLSAKDFSLGYDYMGTIGLFRAWNVDIKDAGIAEASS